MYIFKQKAGVISKKDCWVCFHSCYMYIADTLMELIWVIITEWKQDRHLVG